MSEILKGKAVADGLCARLSEETKKLKENGVTPTLVLVRVGERSDDVLYEKGIVKRCESVGVDVRKYILPSDADEETLVSTIREAGEDDGVHGILVFLPLPEHIDSQRVKRAIPAEKDVDGVTEGSMAGVYSGRKLGFAPCTAEAVVKILEHYEIPLSGKNAVILGRSLVIGRPVSMLLMEKNATVTICHSGTKNAAQKAAEADILVAAVGRAKFAGAEFFAPGQTVIDVGINFTEEGGPFGDADFDAASGVVDAISPVPGGVGAVTTAVLASHVVEAAKRRISE